MAGDTESTFAGRPSTAEQSTIEARSECKRVMPDTWFNAGFHFGYNLIRHCNHPFRDIAEMDRTILKRRNALGSPMTLSTLVEISTSEARRVSRFPARGEDLCGTKPFDEATPAN
jgi:hypothetical protein